MMHQEPLMALYQNSSENGGYNLGTNKKENLSILFNTRTMRTPGAISAKALFELTL